MKYEGRELEYGEEVKIFSGIEQTYLGIATYKGDETGSPCFLLNGIEIYGYESWWIPVKEATKAEEEVKGRE